METAALLDIAQESMIVLFKLTLPVLLTALVVGFVISLIQALTQIQEPTIAFVPKMLAVFIVILILLPYFGKVMINFTEHIASIIIHLE